MPASDKLGSAQPTGQRTVGVIAETTYFRESLVRCLAQRPYTIAVDLGSGDEGTVERVSHIHPEIVLMEWPAAPSTEGMNAILGGSPDTRLIMLGIPDDEAIVLQLAEAGVAGFVSPSSSLDDLLAAIESALRSELTCSPKISAALFRRVATLSRSNGTKKDGPQLTARENQIIQMIECWARDREDPRAPYP